MPNQITVDGLETATQAELVATFTAAMQDIYGADINLASDTPDGQMMYIFIQAVLDLEDLLVQIYNMFDPDNAIGVVLDQRVAINGIQRQAGTETVTNVTIITSQALNLYGLDQDVQPVFTVADNAGNRWLLQETQNVVGSGTYVYAFQAENPGAVLTVPNTITVPVTIVLGVTSINNPTTYTTLGINEETDAALKVRRQKSVSLASQGYYAGLLAALENVNGVTSAFVYENLTGSTDADGIPSHSIWVIVAGTGAAADIAQAIYTKRNAGCGMFGDEVYTITQIDGSPFNIFWDTVVQQNLFIFFTATSIDGTTAPNIATIRAGLPGILIPGVNEEVNINEVATAVQTLDPNTLVTLAGLSAARIQTITLSGVAASGTFKLSYNGNDSGTLNWNDSAATIQTALRLVAGLSACTVSGTPVSGPIVITLNEISSEALIYFKSSTLATVAPVTITFAYTSAAANTLDPTSKKYQFVTASANVVILPMILSPPTVTLVHGNTQTFAGLGGFGPYTYSILVNNSGGTINATSGLYTAGATPSVLDTVKVLDALGNSATAIVTVT